MTNIVSLRSDGSHAPHAPSERRTQQRARILDAARQVFAQKRTAATMSDIAAAAEVSHGLTYRYFTSKEQIFADIVEQAAQSAPWEGFLTMAGSPLERLRILVARVVYLQGPRGEFQGIARSLLRGNRGPAGFPELVRRQHRAMYTVMRQLIVEGQRVGEYRRIFSRHNYTK